VTFLNTKPISIRVMNKARSGRGRGANPGRGYGRQGKSRDAIGLPKRAGEVGACAELGNNMFTLGKDSKAKDADQFRKTSEAMALYIGTKYGEESAREFEQCAEFVHPIPAVDAAVTLIHGAKVLAHTTHITAKLTAMRLLKVQLHPRIPPRLRMLLKSFKAGHRRAS